MLLNYQTYGAPGAMPPLLIAHGLFGSSRNWRAIARQLSRDREVVVIDMRNHGESFHDARHDYPSMAADLAAVIRHIGGPCDLLGHSMGGKAAMVLALSEHDLINRLIVADIAPVGYSHSHLAHIDALIGLDLAQISSRSAADAALKTAIPEDLVRGFLLQNLIIGSDENRWLLNLPVLRAAQPAVIGFPEVDGQFDGEVLFIFGERSEYVTSAHKPLISKLFPKVQFHIIAGAGHWVQADKPKEFITTVQQFIT